MKAFWLLVMIVNISSVFTNIIAFNETGHWYNLVFAFLAVVLAAWCGKKMDEIEW